MHPLNKKKIAQIALVIAVVLLVGSALFTKAATRKRVVKKPTAVPAVSAPAPVIDYTRPFAVMIDNHPGARPQSGIAKADAVWEALVEGGLTRNMAVFRSASATEIGPVRSARPYFLDWAREADAVYSHVGGSDEALSDLASNVIGLDDANEFSNGKAYTRDSRRDAPHNTYTSSERMRSLIVSKKWRAETDAYDPSPRTTASATGVPATHVLVTYLENGEQAEFRWDTDASAYALWRNGRQMRDRDGTPILPKTVVALEMNIVPITDPQAKGLIGIKNTGSGKAIVFRSGVAITGTWKKASAPDPTSITGTDGQKIPFSQGQVWYAVIAPNRGGNVTFK